MRSAPRWPYRVASGRGDRVTIIAFSDRIERLVPVGSGARGIRRAYEKLYDLSPRLGEPAYDLASEAALGLGSRFATVVLFTSVVDLAAAEVLHAALKRLERRHRPLLILGGPELELAGARLASGGSLARWRPGNSPENWRPRGASAGRRARGDHGSGQVHRRPRGLSLGVPRPSPRRRRAPRADGSCLPSRAGSTVSRTSCRRALR
jgi:hypothetical protein